MPTFEPPPVPDIRRDAGDAWLELWKVAHRTMQSYDRRPGMHLIDGMIGDRDRAWLRHHLDAIALVTTGDDENTQADGRRHWTIRLHDPATMRRVSVRVVIERDSTEIFNAFPVARPGGR